MSLTGLHFPLLLHCSSQNVSRTTLGRNRVQGAGERDCKESEEMKKFRGQQEMVAYGISQYKSIRTLKKLVKLFFMQIVETRNTHNNNNTK